MMRRVVKMAAAGGGPTCSAAGGLVAGWRPEPESILTADGGTLELADSGDPDFAAEVLRRLAGRERIVYSGRGPVITMEK
jgi:hypothetical protein